MKKIRKQVKYQNYEYLDLDRKGGALALWLSKEVDLWIIDKHLNWFATRVTLKKKNQEVRINWVYGSSDFDNIQQQ